jgi:putative ABC transport system substrate-binding protein
MLSIARREFIALFGGAAVAWPLTARAQQTMPIIGYLRSGSRVASSEIETAFRQGLGTVGYVEGRNVSLDYNYAENQNDQLPVLASELTHRPVAVIYAGDSGSAIAAKRATSTIPIVFRTGADPIQLGLVASLNRPGSNLTGVSFLTTTTGAIRLQMLHEAVPKAKLFGLLVNPTNPTAEPDSREAQDAASKLGLDLLVVGASSAAEIDTAFVTFVQRGVQALVIDGNSLFSNRRKQLAALTMRHAIPTISTSRELPDVNTLMSYGASNVDADHLAGAYVGRVLKGEKPADLPVQQSVKVELILNLIAAKALGITFPATLLARADEVIE